MSVNGTCRVCGAIFSGRQNHCTGCHQTFASERGGDSHRDGTYDPPTRRCRTLDELTTGGMWTDQRGVWHGTWNNKGIQRRRAI